MVEMSAKDYQKLVINGPKKSKFKAKKTPCRLNHLHDSEKEAIRCDLLNVLLRGGVISQLKQQPRIVLQRRFKIDEKKIRRIVYYADFSYIEDGRNIIEDCKGFRTRVYKLKKKLLLNILRKRKKKWYFVES